MSKAKDESPTVTLKALGRFTSITHNDETYKVDADGFVDVPVAEAAAISCLGFREATEEDLIAAAEKNKKK